MRNLASRWVLSACVALHALLVVLSAQPVAGFMVWTHATITEEALERFPAGTTLTERERKELVDGATATDRTDGGWVIGGRLISERYDARFHFDNNLNYLAIRENFQAMMRLVRENLTRSEKDSYGFGKILHAIEDFYSHSNYLNLYDEYRRRRDEPVDSAPTLEEVLLHPERYPGFPEMLTQRLRTGHHPDEKPVQETDHGNPMWRGPGLNKDSCF